jgi:hypothetical protein
MNWQLVEIGANGVGHAIQATEMSKKMEVEKTTPGENLACGSSGAVGPCGTFEAHSSRET